MRQYKRKVSVIVGNDKIADSPNAINIEHLRIRFEVEKIAFGNLNTCTIQIYNLSDKSVAKMEKQFTKIIVNAGYEGQDNPLLCTSDIVNITHTRQNADTITTIYAKDGAQAYLESTINKTVNEKMTAREVFKQVASTMEGIRIGDISVIPDKPIYIGDKTLSGSAKDELTTICNTFDAHWQIVDGEISASPNIMPEISTVRHEFSASNGMIGIPTITILGINVVSLLRPQVKPMHSFRVLSDFSNVDMPYMNLINWKGRYEQIENKSCRVMNLKHVGDTHGNEWFTQCAGLYAGQSVMQGIGYVS
jgi:hypothetical protein